MKQQLLFDKSVVYAGQEPSWSTPPEVFDALDKAFGGFELDVCANADNAKCPNFISPERDTLDPAIKWSGLCWMNPPYGLGIELFLAKANLTALNRAGRVVCLLPDNFSSSWFRLYCQHWPFLVWPQRIKFIHPDGSRGERPANGNIVVAMGYSAEELPEIEFYKKGEGRFVIPWFVQAR